MRPLRKAHWEILAIAGAVFLGAVLRCWYIRYSFDGDEMFSVSLASGSFAHTIARSLADTPHPPLYNILLHFWISLVGSTELAARALSVLFSCGFIIFAYRLMRRYADAWCSAGVALLAALSPLFIFYGQQARPYSLIALLSTVNLYAFLKALDTPEQKRPIAIWALTGVALVYSHYVGVLFIGVQMVWALFERVRGRWRFLVWGTAAAASVGLWAFAAMGAKALNGINPIPQIAWIGPPQPQDFVWFYVSIFGAQIATRWLLAILAVLAIAYARSHIVTRSLPKEHRLLLLLAFGLPLFAYAVSVWGSQSIFVSRQLEGAALAMLVAVGSTTAELPKGTARLFLVALIAWTATAARTAMPDVLNPPWQESARWIEQSYGSTPIVTEEPFCHEAIAFYRTKGTVLLWRDLPENAKHSRFLFACRPNSCNTLKRNLAGRATLEQTWHWNRDAGNTPFNRLKLYSVRPQVASASP